MSDFLTNLAARSLAPPTLRPRTLSRFEPATLGEAPETASEEPAPKQMRASSPAPPPVSAPTSTRDAATATHDQVLHERTHEVVREGAERVVVHHEESREIRVEAPRELTTREVRVVSPRDTDTRERRPAPAIERSETRDAAPAEREREAARVEVHHRDRIVPLSQPAMRTTSRIHRASEPVAAAAEPVIHVSIGRVEVRAVTSPTPQRSSRRNAAMTIDDYVARKKAKERR